MSQVLVVSARSRIWTHSSRLWPWATSRRSTFSRIIVPLCGVT